MPVRILAALGLVLHAGMHISFFMPDWFFEVRGSIPFDLTHSDLLSSVGIDPGLWSVVGTILVVLTIGGLVIGAAWILGLVPERYGAPLLALGAIASAASIVVFFHSWLFVGLIVDLAILAAVAATRWLSSAIEG